MPTLDSSRNSNQSNERIVDADGEDAYAMKLEFPENKGVHQKKEEKKD